MAISFYIYNIDKYRMSVVYTHIYIRRVSLENSFTRLWCYQAIQSRARGKRIIMQFWPEGAIKQAQEREWDWSISGTMHSKRVGAYLGCCENIWDWTHVFAVEAVFKCKGFRNFPFYLLPSVISLVLIHRGRLSCYFYHVKQSHKDFLIDSMRTFLLVLLLFFFLS